MVDRRLIFDSTSSDNALTFRFPAKRNVAKLIFIGVWLMGWTVGCLAAANAILNGTGGLFVLFWLAFWVWGGAKILQSFFWALAGFEELSITPDALRIARVLPYWRKTHTYDTRAVTGLHVRANAQTSSATATNDERFGYHAGRDKGVLRFDNGGHPIGFGLGLRREDAEQARDMILRRFPQLGPRS